MSKVTINDVNTIIEYHEEFGVTMSAEYKAFLAALKAKYSEGEELISDDQDKLKVFAMKEVTTNTHESYQDEIWDAAKVVCKEELKKLEDE